MYFVGYTEGLVRFLGQPYPASKRASIVTTKRWRNSEALEATTFDIYLHPTPLPSASGGGTLDSGQPN